MADRSEARSRSARSRRELIPSLDLSNNNGTVDFELLHRVGQRRAELKVSEGTHFTDDKFRGFRKRAHRAGIKTGGYHFARPHDSSPEAEARYFLSKLPALVRGLDLKPVLDIEQGQADRHVGAWCERFCAIVHERRGVRPLVYSYASYLEEMRLSARFIASHWFWVAAYGRDDGREHPFSISAALRKRVAAHQYADHAHLLGHDFQVDISHVYNARAFELR